MNIDWAIIWVLAFTVPLCAWAFWLAGKDWNKRR
jgi:hypothetical protein